MLITIPITPTLTPVLTLLAAEAEAWAANLTPGVQQDAWTNLATALRGASPEQPVFSFEAPLTVLSSKEEKGELSNDRLHTMRCQADSRGSKGTRRAWQEIVTVLEGTIVRGRLAEDLMFLTNMIANRARDDLAFSIFLAHDPEALAAARTLGLRIHEWEKTA